ncbi:MAG: glycosyltransferase [Burkholderiaceae bacterium]|nr:glycosyltransferase [Burkholderiaceae bacterium]
MDAAISSPAAVAAPAEAPLAAVPADRITELYRGAIFTDETSRAARDRIHWMCAQCDGERVLDVGCSQGIASILLAREGFKVTAIDTHPESIAFARREIEAESRQVQQRLTLIETDLASLPEVPTYDTILLGEVIEHQARPERLLRAAKARLNPDGRLVCTTPFGLHPHPDHKVSLFPRHFAEFASSVGLAMRSMIADGRNIFCVFARADAEMTCPPADLVSIMERATLESQALLLTRINELSGEMRRKMSALKTAQVKLAQITREGETLRTAARASAAELLEQRTRGDNLNEAVFKLKAQHAKELAEAATALQNERGVRETVNEQRLAALDELEAAREALTKAEEAREAHRLASFDELEAARGAITRAEESHKADRLASLAELEAAREALAKAEEAREAQVIAVTRDAKVAADAIEARMSDEVHLARIKAERRVHALAAAHKYELTKLDERYDKLLARLRLTQASFAEAKATTSYRLGRLLVRGFKSPKDFVGLPLNLARLARDVMRRRRTRALLAVQDDPGAPDAPTTTIAAKVASEPERTSAPPVKTTRRSELAAKPATPVRNAAKVTPVPDTFGPEALGIELQSGGVAAVRARLMAPGADVPASTRALAALELGRFVTKSAGAETDFALASLALEFDRSEPVLRGYFWAAQRSSQMEATYAAFRELDAIYTRHPEPRFEALREKLQRSPAVQLQAFELVVSSPVDAIEPIANRICYVLHNSLPYSSGGYATRAQGVSGGLKAAGYEVVTVTRPGFPIDTKPELRGTVIPLEDQIDGDRFVRILEPERTPGMPVLPYMKAAAEAVERKLRALRPAAVIAASNYRTALPALIAARRMGVPFVYEVRGFWEVTRISREPEYQDTPAYAAQSLLETKVAQLADHVFTLTGPMSEELIKRGVPADKIDLLPNSCDPERFVPRPRDEALAALHGIPNGTPVIGYVGTFVDYEGLEDLVLACAMLKQRGLTFRLMLVGNENASGTNTGPITAEILRIANAEDMCDWLIMPGRVPHEMVEAYYSLIDIAAFPRKPWPVCEMVSPMKPLEALAMEKAVLVSSVRALVEMIADEHTGLVFAKGDVASMADALAKLIGDPALRARLGRNGRSWVCAERTWTQVGRKLDERLRVLSSGGPKAACDSTARQRLEGQSAAPAGP